MLTTIPMPVETSYSPLQQTPEFPGNFCRKLGRGHISVYIGIIKEKKLAVGSGVGRWAKKKKVKNLAVKFKMRG